MKKRTKAELVIFVIVAAIYLISLMRDRPAQPSPAAPTAAQETQASFIPLTEPVTESSPEETLPGETETETETAAVSTGNTETVVSEAPPSEIGEEITVVEDGAYTDAEHVALYIHTYGRLPDNFITKQEAAAAGWDSEKGNLAKVLPGYSIGGDYYGNYEKLLPKKKGRKYYECDIDYKKGRRGAKRIVFSNDGLVYYTDDHYRSFTLMYGEE